MYNAFIQKRKNQQQRALKMKSASLQKFVENYYVRKQPELINRYNKRINDFIRKVQHQPIIIKLNPYQKDQVREKINQKQDKIHGINRKFSLQSSVSKDNTQQQNFIGGQQNRSFKFKNIQDWTSIYTSLQRLQRQKNYQAFKLKFGDPNIAFRSIGSQSDYHPHHQFRPRQQNLEINPPMKYTNKPTQQVLARINSKNKKKQLKHKNTNKLLDLKSSLDNKNLMNSSVQSVIGFGDQATQNLTSNHLQSSGEDGKQFQSEVGLSKRQQKEKKKKNTNKVYFKQIMDLQQSTKQMGSKKILRNILYKCGVYRKKNKRATTEIQIDQFSQFQTTGPS